MSYSIEDFKAVVEQQLEKHPNTFWAKKFDDHAHIPKRNENGYGIVCGIYGGLLGSNYARGLTTICPTCLKLAYDDISLRNKLLGGAGI